MNTTTITANETLVLVSGYNCHYGEAGNCVWAWAHNDSNKPHNLPKPSVPGVIGSLVKKGLMFSDHAGTADAVIGLTETGTALAAEHDSKA